MKKRHLPLVIIAALLAFNIGMLVREPAVRVWLSPGFLAEWFRVGRVMRLVHTRHVDAEKVAFHDIARRACDGAASGLDRYSAYLDETACAEQNRAADQLFTGIGVIMTSADGLIRVSRLLPGGGAETAGLRPGDRILAADGASLVGLPPDEAGGKIRGAENTVVTLSVLRPGETAPKDIRVTRRTITVSTVADSRMEPDSRTAYVALAGFERRTPDEVREAVSRLLAAGADRLVLDLRGNPGGLVDAAVGVTGLFCPQGVVVATLEGRTAEDSVVYRTRTAPSFPTLPLVVLTDGHSASASEILAGALRDHRRAALVGARTFGKGVVQSVFSLDADTGLKLTTARYALPLGAKIHGVGVRPDLAVGESPLATSRRLVESTLAEVSDGPAGFARRFGYTPAPDAALAAAVALLDAATQKPAKPL